MATTHAARDRRHFDDAQLAADILAGVDGAFARLSDEYSWRIARFVSSRIWNQAETEDLVQDVLLEVYLSIGSWEGRARLSTWIFGIAHRVICRSFRRRKLLTIPLDACIGGLEPFLEARVDEQVDARRTLERCAEVLEREVSSRQREVFDLYYGEGRRTRTIAENLAKSDSAVKVSLLRTRRAMERRIGRLAS